MLRTVIQVCIEFSGVRGPWPPSPKPQCQASPVPAAGVLEAGSAGVMLVSWEVS